MPQSVPVKAGWADKVPQPQEMRATWAPTFLADHASSPAQQTDLRGECQDCCSGCLGLPEEANAPWEQALPLEWDCPNHTLAWGHCWSLPRKD